MWQSISFGMEAHDIRVGIALMGIVLEYSGISRPQHPRVDSVRCRSVPQFVMDYLPVAPFTNID